MIPPRASAAGFLATLVVCGVAVGCDGETSAPGDPIALRDSASVSIVDNDLSRLGATCAVDAEPLLSIGDTEGEEPYQLYRVFGATRLSDGRIALVNQGSQEVRYYDPSGEFLASAGGAGEGPGEFRNAFYLWAQPGDTLWVGDYFPWRFNVFGPAGRFLKTVRLEGDYVNADVFGVLDDGHVAIAEREFPLGHPAGVFTPVERTVMVHDAAGAFADTVATLENGRWGVMSDDPDAVGLYPFFESFSSVATGGSRIVAGHQSRPELRIYEVADDGVRMTRIVRWTTGVDRTVTDADVAAQKETETERFADMSEAMKRQLLDPLVRDDRPVADVLPAFRDPHVGRDGRIWVHEYRRPTAAEPGPWLAFDGDGRFQCRATLPDYDEILEFGADYLLAKSRDNLGVERVVMHRLRAPERP